MNRFQLLKTTVLLSALAGGVSFAEEPDLVPMSGPATPAAPSAPSASTTAPTAPAVAPSKELAAAITQLADDDAAVRQTAQDQIVQIGKDATEPLKALIASTSDVEQRNGAQAALARILEQASTGPTLVTLKMQNVSASQIIAELAKQSGVPLKNYAANNGNFRGMANGNGNGAGGPKTLSINVDRQPFWTAVKEVSTVTGLMISTQGRAGSLGFGQGGNDLTGPCAVDGPFMVIAQSINMSSNVQLSQPGNINRNENIQFMCFAEPKLQISQHPYNIKLTEVTDDTGKSLVIAANDGNYMGYNSDARTVWNASANLVVPDPAAKKITKLKGTMRLQAATKIETIEIGDLMTAKNVTKSAGGVSLTVKNLTTNGDNVTMNVTLMVPPSRGGNVGYNIAQNIRVMDAAGNALQNQGLGGGGSMTKLEYQMTFSKRYFDEGEQKTGDPAKLTLPVATETKPIDCNFEFKDLPLP